MHEIIMLHVNMKILKFDINNLYVIINMLHVDIIYRGFRGKKYDTISTKKTNVISADLQHVLSVSIYYV